MVVRSDNISALNTAGIQAMWDYGINAVLDLRSGQEIARFPSPFEPADFGPHYLHVPLVDDALAEELTRTPSTPQRYQMMLDRRQEAIGRIVTTIARVEEPLVFHCFAGKDRTGLVAAMLLSAAGVKPDVIAADYAETDQHLAERYEEWLAAAPADRVEAMRDELRCPPEWMLGVLDHLDRTWGGAEPYLTAAGVEPQDLLRVKAKLTG
jgi:protein-tyrosine phosphatase